MRKQCKRRVCNPEKPSESKSCGKPATHRVFWPGREPHFDCEQHACQERHLGDVMGCYVYIEKVEGGKQG